MSLNSAPPPSSPETPAAQAAYGQPGGPPPAPSSAGAEESEAAGDMGALGALGAAQTATPAARSAPGATGGGMVAEKRKTEEPAAKDRPGLGTAWGESVSSRTTTAAFVRDRANPWEVAALWYNDREGANAMSRHSDYRAASFGSAVVLGGALTVTVRDDRGQQLSGFTAGGKSYVIGEPGQRYVIVVRNNTGYRFECVATVDGLDVIDGQPGAFHKRGYLIQPNATLEIEGFRRSAEQVAAFRFSSVRGSYSAKTGQGDRNVGVIGVAFFNEAGTNPKWTPEEVDRRHNADPFPARYATPPPH